AAPGKRPGAFRLSQPEARRGHVLRTGERRAGRPPAHGARGGGGRCRGRGNRVARFSRARRAPTGLPAGAAERRGAREQGAVARLIQAHRVCH
ncbi:hypothetical protein MNEG_16669, partial [Monoraphidium neglectum]